MGIGTIRGLVTLALLLAFVAIVIWAYSKRRKADFDEMAELPFHEYPPEKDTREQDPMTSGWSLFVVFVTLFNILGCVWLLRWTAKPRTADEKIGGGADTGHVWDKDLREYNNPLPRWWLWLFYITVVFGVVYLVAVPGPRYRSRASRAGHRPASTSRRRRRPRRKAAAYLAPFAAMTVPAARGRPARRWPRRATCSR